MSRDGPHPTGGARERRENDDETKQPRRGFLDRVLDWGEWFVLVKELGSLTLSILRFFLGR